jgi:Flp pilus assembly protein TadG
MNKKFLPGEHGQSLVEVAVSLSVLMMMILGVIEGSWLLYTYHYLSYAARQGSRYAMVRGSACDPSNGMDNCPNATSNQIQAYVRNVHFPGVDPNQVGVTVNWSAGPQSGGTCASPCQDPGDQVSVQATYPFPLSIPFIPASRINMTSTSEVVIAQ